MPVGKYWFAAFASLALASVSTARDLSADNETAPAPLELVHLVDVASIEFEPDPARLKDWQQWPGSWNNDFFLVVDQAGDPIHCEPFDAARQDELAERLCADLIANARLDILDGYRLGGRQGVVALTKEPFVSIPGLPGSADASHASVPLAIGSLDPRAFTDYTSLRDFEQGETPGLVMKPPEVQPTYPPKSLRAGHEGRSGVLLEIGSDARVVSCRPFETSGYARLDSAACRFALDTLEFDVEEVGTAQAPYYFKLKMTWLIPEPPE